MMVTDDFLSASPHDERGALWECKRSARGVSDMAIHAARLNTPPLKYIQEQSGLHRIIEESVVRLECLGRILGQLP